MYGKIELELGEEVYVEVFDDFLHDWLTVVKTPAPLVSRDVYCTLKQYTQEAGFDCGERIVSDEG
ncbi:hypothetical protein CRD59_01985 [Bifidobacterium xylocopae]|uniref:Uncharacterized protein n=1 Tax=Bifidobacterium xylocopae TaxID=2493119 RepID=A0A366KDK3_9BIFI|nr:hypothetical protein CRD59_01985 [Bifidobacterium xylocopae]